MKSNSKQTSNSKTENEKFQNIQDTIIIFLDNFYFGITFLI